MSFLERVRNVMQGRDAAPAAPAGPADTSAEGADRPPIRGYDKLDARAVGERLSALSQVELGAVETYERSHEERPEVLAKLRYMRGNEPLPGYDELSPEQIVEALAEADAGTVKAVRDYERKFGHRAQVLDETARVLPTATQSPEETQLRADRTTRVREGIAGRAKTARDLAKDNGDRHG